MIERALLSVYDKTDLDAFARGLAELGVELVASGGTAAYIEEHELGVTLVEELTGVGELLGGRVKTLHPRIHAAILARQDEREDVAALEELDVRPFQLVCVNLYPFGQIAWRRGVDEADAVEMIDVGGPAMLRAAAKNFTYVAPVCRPDQYEGVLAELRDARRALTRDSAVACGRGVRDDVGVRVGDRKLVLGPGVVPREGDGVVREGARPRVRREPAPARRAVRGGRSAAPRALARRAAPGEAALVQQPPRSLGRTCGRRGVHRAGVRDHQAREPVRRCPRNDRRRGLRESARGRSRVGLRRRRRLQPARRGGRSGSCSQRSSSSSSSHPGTTPTRSRCLRGKPAMRVLLDAERRHASPGERDYRRVLGGILVQDRDADIEDREGMEVVCGEPTEDDWGELLFAWRVCKHGLSNAIVVAGELQTLGIGIGQMSRVDAVRIALAKARDLGHELAGAALASDAFFPFADGPRLALDAGVRAIIQPGGSKRDAEVIAAVEEAGAAMVFTGRRHFRH